MGFMNQQDGRAGKIQLELGRDRAGQLARALANAAAFSPDPTVRTEAFQLQMWIDHRRAKKWGMSEDGTAESQTGIDTGQRAPKHRQRGRTATGTRRART